MRRFSDPRLVYLVHRGPGRLRLRLRWLRDAPDEATALADRLAALPGAAEVEVRPSTGSVLVRYDPELLDGERVVDEVLRATGVDHTTLPGHESAEEVRALLNHAAARGRPLGRALVVAARRLNLHVLRLTDGQLSLGMVVSAGLLGTAAAQVVARGEIELPEWYQLLWWSFRSFTTTESDLLAEVPASTSREVIDAEAAESTKQT
jgi:hypothetical protein